MTEADDGRRRFLMLMGLACASTTLAAFAPGAIAAPPTTPAPAADAEPKPPSTEARALGDAVRARWPGRLDEAQQAALVSDLDDRVDGGRALRAMPFANGDEPDFEFRA